MREYRIVCRERLWHLVIEGQEHGLLKCDDRGYLIRIACKVAAERRSSVQVFDASDELEARLCFEDGALTVSGRYEGDLELGARVN